MIALPYTFIHPNQHIMTNLIWTLQFHAQSKNPIHYLLRGLILSTRALKIQQILWSEQLQGRRILEFLRLNQLTIGLNHARLVVFLLLLGTMINFRNQIMKLNFLQCEYTSLYKLGNIEC